jgi:hypothetical protein
LSVAHTPFRTVSLGRWVNKGKKRKGQGRRKPGPQKWGARRMGSMT